MCLVSNNPVVAASLDQCDSCLSLAEGVATGLAVNGITSGGEDGATSTTANVLEYIDFRNTEQTTFFLNWSVKFEHADSSGL